MNKERTVCRGDTAEKLANKWISAERQYREQVREAMTAGTPYRGMAAHADQLRECRRELQTAFGLVARERMKTEKKRQKHDND
ncbi:MAG TPA: hypothetical protein VKA94_04070 [Hyphomicrobiales bacterium]|nr:hypothetical protein [Hyphomicrobiales bacterium]